MEPSKTPPVEQGRKSEEKMHHLHLWGSRFDKRVNQHFYKKSCKKTITPKHSIVFPRGAKMEPKSEP